MSWRDHLRPSDPHPPSGIEPQPRTGIRCVLLDGDHRVLLQQIVDPKVGLPLWITPGGGVEPGESEEAGLLREVREETGIVQITLGPVVWTRQHVFEFNGRWYHQRERFYLGRYLDHEHRQPELEDLELGIILGHRWWTLDEIDQSSEEIAPAAISLGIRRILAEGPPATPYDIGI